MKTLYFASANRGKTLEMRKLFAGIAEIEDLNSLAIPVTWEETGDTFQANAEIKVRAVRSVLAGPIFGDDSGLCVEALGGAPGIYSARWAGKDGDDEANNQKLLKELANVPMGKRQAYFFCSVVYKDEKGEEFCFEGRVDGHILIKPQGTEGFGYDPLFVPVGFDRTLAEIPLKEKNLISHRALAIGKLKDFLARA